MKIPKILLLPPWRAVHPLTIGVEEGAARSNECSSRVMNVGVLFLLWTRECRVVNSTDTVMMICLTSDW